jgi:hypothetical protein
MPNVIQNDTQIELWVINNLIFEISERFWWSRKFDVF